MKPFDKKRLLSIVGAVSLALAVPSAGAAECKEMSQSQCEKSSSCSYVKGYKTKTGTKVDAYCRNKGGKKKSSSSKGSKDSSKSKSSSKSK